MNKSVCLLFMIPFFVSAMEKNITLYENSQCIIATYSDGDTTTTATLFFDERIKDGVLMTRFITEPRYSGEWGPRLHWDCPIPEHDYVAAQVKEALYDKLKAKQPRRFQQSYNR